MFDLIFNTLSAMNQAAALLAALVCGGLGGLLVGSALYWRLHAVRVQGEVIGVRRNGNCYNAVYRYATPSGQMLEATSLEGSSSTSGKATGTQVPLLLIPDKPTEVQEARSHVFTVVGVVLLAAGAGILYYTVRSWRAGPMTWIVAGLFVVHLLRGLRRVLRPKDKSLRSLSLSGLMASRQGGATDTSPVLRAEDLEQDPAAGARASAQRATLRRYAPLFLLAGIGLLALGVYQSRSLLRLESAGIRAPGVVSGFSTSSSNNGVSYYPLVTYTDAAGHSVVFKDRTGTNPPLYRTGERITVLYLASEQGSAIIDRGLWNWLPSVLLYLLGGGLCALGLALLRSPPAAEPVLGTSS